MAKMSKSTSKPMPKGGSKADMTNSGYKGGNMKGPGTGSGMGGKKC